MNHRLAFAVLLSAAASWGCGKKEEPQAPPVSQAEVPAAPAPSVAPAAQPAAAPRPPAPKPATATPATVKAAPKAGKPAAAKPAGSSELTEAGRKAATHAEAAVLKEIVNPGAPEIVGSKRPVMLYYYAVWSPWDRKFMGVVEELAQKYKAKADFYRVDTDAARKAGTLPADVIAMPYMVFLKDGKKDSKLAHPGEARKELEFFLEEWLSE